MTLRFASGHAALSWAYTVVHYHSLGNKKADDEDSQRRIAMATAIVAAANSLQDEQQRHMLVTRYAQRVEDVTKSAVAIAEYAAATNSVRSASVRDGLVDLLCRQDGIDNASANVGKGMEKMIKTALSIEIGAFRAIHSRLVDLQAIGPYAPMFTTNGERQWRALRSRRMK